MQTDFWFLFHTKKNRQIWSVSILRIRLSTHTCECCANFVEGMLGVVSAPPRLINFCKHFNLPIYHTISPSPLFPPPSPSQKLGGRPHKSCPMHICCVWVHVYFRKHQVKYLLLIPIHKYTQILSSSLTSRHKQPIKMLSQITTHP